MATIFNPTQPRKLDAMRAYIELLNSRDDADKVYQALAGQTATQLETLMSRSSATVSVGNVTSAAFNKYIVKYIINNINIIAPAVIALIDADIAAQKFMAEDESELNDLFGGVTTFPVAFTIGTASTYNLVGTDLPGSAGGGAVTVPWKSVPALPAGLSIDPTTGDISGTATGPAGVFEVTVTGSSATESIVQKLTITIS